VRHDPIAQANPERRQRRAQHQRIAEEDDGRDPTARQLCIGRITVTMTIQIASANSPLYLQAMERPKASLARADQRSGRRFRKPEMNAAIANRPNASAEISASRSPTARTPSG